MESCMSEYPCEHCYDEEYETTIHVRPIDDIYAGTIQISVCEYCLDLYAENEDGSFSLK